MRKIIIVLFLCSTFLYIINAQNSTEKGLQAINQNMLKGRLSFISSDWFEGREATTKGAFMAADYLASIYNEDGLSVYDNNSYFQDVPLLISYAPKQAHIILKDKQSSKTFKFPDHLRTERFPFSFDAERALIWGGYGINAEGLSEIDLKHSKGKILIRLSGLPKAQENDSELGELIKQKSDKAWLQIKRDMLQSSGVYAVIEYNISDPYLQKSLINTPIKKQAAVSEKHLNRRSSGIYDKNLTLPNDNKKSPHYFQVSKAFMETLVSNFEQQLKNYLTNLEYGRVSPIKNFSCETIKLQVEANTEYKKCRNVLAVIEGSEYPDEIIVVGAHYDHLGMYDGYIWNGADDNGSGTIGLTAIAKAFVSTGIQPKRTIIFANWTAEERGLLGSRYFVSQFKNIDKIKCYHNYDMIGRSYNAEKPDSAVTLMYTKTWKKVEDLLRKNIAENELDIKIKYSAWDNPSSGSDNAPFAKKGIPIMWFHTGGHESYHMPSDQADLIDWQKFEAIVKSSFLILWELANE